MTTTTRRRARKRAEQAAPAAVSVLPGQLALFVEQPPAADPLRIGAAGEASWRVTKTEAVLGLPAVTWTIDLVPEQSRLAVPIDTALTVGARATLAPPGPVAKSGGPFVEYGAQTDGLHEYFLSKAGPCGVMQVRRKDDGTWHATMTKTAVPYVLSKDAVEAHWMPPAGTSALPATLERVVPRKYRYWDYPGEQAGAVRNALVESGLFDDRLIKAVDGELRLLKERLFLYEPDDAEPVGKSATPPAPATLRDVLPGILGPLAKHQLVTPLSLVSGEVDVAAAIAETAAPDAVLLLSSTRADNIPEVVGAVAKTQPPAWIVEHDDTPEARAYLSMLGHVFKVDTVDAHDRIFVASFHPASEARVRWVAPGSVEKRVKTADFQGLTVKVDRPKGYVQRGKDENGQAWERTYQHDYGYLPRTKGGDGDGLDVFLGPNPESKTAYWVAQKKADGSFDEYKVFLGFDSEEQAKAAYTAHIPERFFSHMTATSVEQMKSLLNKEPEEVVKALAPAGGADFSVRVVKGSDVEKGDEHYVLGIVLEPEVVDAQNDIYSPDEIRSTAHKFMEQFRTIGLMHKGAVNDKVKILESFIAPADMEIGEQPVKKGTWLMAVRVLDDELWKACKSGELTGFSIGGSALRKPDAAATAAKQAGSPG